MAWYGKMGFEGLAAQLWAAWVWVYVDRIMLNCLHIVTFASVGLGSLGMVRFKEWMHLYMYR